MLKTPQNLSQIHHMGHSMEWRDGLHVDGATGRVFGGPRISIGDGVPQQMDIVEKRLNAPLVTPLALTMRAIVAEDLRMRAVTASSSCSL